MTRWYSVKYDGSYKEYISLAYAEVADGITVQEYEFKEDNFTGFRYHFHYDGKFNDGVKVGDCQLVYIKAKNYTYINKPGSSVYAVFADKEGVKIEPKSRFGESIHGVANAIKYVAEISKCETLEKYTLLKTVEELYKKVELLEIELLNIKGNLVSETAPSQ